MDLPVSDTFCWVRELVMLNGSKEMISCDWVVQANALSRIAKKNCFKKFTFKRRKTKADGLTISVLFQLNIVPTR
jgi:hypothetical protein